jgi:hypothetical protein
MNQFIFTGKTQEKHGKRGNLPKKVLRIFYGKPKEAPATSASSNPDEVQYDRTSLVDSRASCHVSRKGYSQ